MIENIQENHTCHYQSEVLKVYLKMPETPARAGPQDRKRAQELYARQIKLATVESALLLASLRRLGRPADWPPLPPIRSLAYFLPVIEELLENPISDDYREYLKRKVQLLTKRTEGSK
jgi:hypothetical protein